ncbi:hypothetical protein CBNA_1609 [Coxiella burnetii str. Namibia]|nr:hypothetical protein CBNA_1609 [Coxiella burnetii str. Namibia]
MINNACKHHNSPQCDSVARMKRSGKREPCISLRSYSYG